MVLSAILRQKLYLVETRTELADRSVIVPELFLEKPTLWVVAVVTNVL